MKKLPILLLLFVVPYFLLAQEVPYTDYQNTERSTHGNTDGLVYYDANFHPEYPEFNGDGGGLSIYTPEDGWGAIFSTNNMRWLTPTFYGGIFNNKVGIGTAAPGALLEVKSSNNNSVRFNKNDTPSITFRPNNGNSIFHIAHNLNNRLTISQGTNVDATNLFTIVNSGNIGVGTTTPSAKLDVNGAFKATHNASGERNIIMEAPSSVNHRGNGTQNATGLVYRLAQNTASGDPIFQVRSQGQAVRFFVEHDGYTGATHNSAWFGGDFNNYFKSNIGIGTKNPGNWKLAVNGKILAKEIKVQTGWSDFVFEDNYTLPTLEEVEQHILEKGHLKDIPSAKEVEENGVYLGEMDAKLLQKIEELMLYTIEQQKRIEKLEELVLELKTNKKEQKSKR
ncbi:hypothetical protein OOZ15_05290 [Galbibacter sp. EGI 63066]|uniref:hypothetical protein n=1 Tax=Galbibacter sp. EGI 63066 TaxID=2993559 RepID=UPI002248DDF7|nr:hypothetical protein [Galbibacter sp. EGI 63066]MCX2679350.1 hypothetical protein [Galbibacter sp. EGI 63066]